jgi:hypothetical protein
MLRRKVWPVAIAGGSSFLVFAVLWALGASNAMSLFIGALTFLVVYPVALVNERKFADTPEPESDPFYDRHEEEMVRHSRGRYP